jgi:alpha-glucosidase
VAPIVRPGVEHRHVYLPAGTWFHWWSGQRYDGPTHILAHAPLGEPAMYARANAPIPLWPEMAYVGQHPPDPLSLVVFPAEGSSSVSLYEDPGEGFEHERGMYARTRLACRTHAGRTTLEIGPREGGFAPQRTRLEVEFRGLSSPPREVHVDGQPFHWHHEGNLVSVHLAASAAAQRIELA